MVEHGKLSPTKLETILKISKLIVKEGKFIRREVKIGMFMHSNFIPKLERLFDGVLTGYVPLRTSKEAREVGRIRAMNINSQVRAAEMGYKDEEMKELTDHLDKAFGPIDKNNSSGKKK